MEGRNPQDASKMRGANRHFPFSLSMKLMALDLPIHIKKDLSSKKVRKRTYLIDDKIHTASTIMVDVGIPAYGFEGGRLD